MHPRKVNGYFQNGVLKKENHHVNFDLVGLCMNELVASVWFATLAWPSGIDDRASKTFAIGSSLARVCFKNRFTFEIL